MPILLNLERGKQTVQQAEFGTGDILIQSIKQLDQSHDSEIWLIQNREKPIEVWETEKDPAYPLGEKTDNLPVMPTIALTFLRKESAIALQRSLTKLINGWPVEDQKE